MRKLFRRNHSGYLEIYKPKHPNARKDGYIRFSRYIMSVRLCRPLEKWEVVHHINGDIHDNRWQNLELLVNSQHDRITRNPNPVLERFCYLCGTDETYRYKGYEYWNYDIDNKLICEYCYQKIRQRYKKSIRCSKLCSTKWTIIYR